MRRCVGRTKESFLDENLRIAIRDFLRMEFDGANDQELAEQRGFIKGCAAQLLSHVNPLHHRSRVALAVVLRTVVREVVEEQGSSSTVGEDLFIETVLDRG